MNQEIPKTRTLDELRGQTIEEFFHEVSSSKEAVTVILEQGEAVVIYPIAALKPLPKLDGYIPEGWKDAIYSQ